MFPSPHLSSIYAYTVPPKSLSFTQLMPIKAEGLSMSEKPLISPALAPDWARIEDYTSYLQAVCFYQSAKAGWWTNLETNALTINEPHIIPEKLALIHSEVSEALEGYRKNLLDDKLPHRKMFEVELADAAIRIFDLAGACGLDLGGALSEKMQYNAQREDHKVENRKLDNGKKF